MVYKVISLGILTCDCSELALERVIWKESNMEGGGISLRAKQAKAEVDITLADGQR